VKASVGNRVTSNVLAAMTHLLSDMQSTSPSLQRTSRSLLPKRQIFWHASKSSTTLKSLTSTTTMTAMICLLFLAFDLPSQLCSFRSISFLGTLVISGPPRFALCTSHRDFWFRFHCAEERSGEASTVYKICARRVRNMITYEGR
jgi:hypothetical protein